MASNHPRNFNKVQATVLIRDLRENTNNPEMPFPTPPASPDDDTKEQNSIVVLYNILDDEHKKCTNHHTVEEDSDCSVNLPCGKLQCEVDKYDVLTKGQDPFLNSVSASCSACLPFRIKEAASSAAGAAMVDPNDVCPHSAPPPKEVPAVKPVVDDQVVFFGDFGEIPSPLCEEEDMDESNEFNDSASTVCPTPDESESDNEVEVDIETVDQTQPPPPPTENQFPPLHRLLIRSGQNSMFSVFMENPVVASRSARSLLRPQQRPALSPVRTGISSYIPTGASMPATLAAIHNYSAPSASAAAPGTSLLANSRVGPPLRNVISTVRHGERRFLPVQRATAATPTVGRPPRRRAGQAAANGRVRSRTPVRPTSEVLAQLDMSSETNRRAYHNVLERKRRDDLRRSIMELRQEIPSLTTENRAPKTQVLQKGAEYIVELTKQFIKNEAVLTAQRERRARLGKYLRQLQRAHRAARR